MSPIASIGLSSIQRELFGIQWKAISNTTTTHHHHHLSTANISDHYDDANSRRRRNAKSDYRESSTVNTRDGLLLLLQQCNLVYCWEGGKATFKAGCLWGQAKGLCYNWIGMQVKMRNLTPFFSLLSPPFWIRFFWVWLWCGPPL